MTWSALTTLGSDQQQASLKGLSSQSVCLMCLQVESPRQTKLTHPELNEHLGFCPLLLLPLQFSISADTCARSKPLAVIPDPSSCPTSTSNATKSPEHFKSIHL